MAEEFELQEISIKILAPEKEIVARKHGCIMRIPKEYFDKQTKWADEAMIKITDSEQEMRFLQIDADETHFRFKKLKVIKDSVYE